MRKQRGGQTGGKQGRDQNGNGREENKELVEEWKRGKTDEREGERLRKGRRGQERGRMKNSGYRWINGRDGESNARERERK